MYRHAVLTLNTGWSINLGSAYSSALGDENLVCGTGSKQIFESVSLWWVCLNLLNGNIVVFE